MMKNHTEMRSHLEKILTALKTRNPAKMGLKERIALIEARLKVIPADVKPVEPEPLPKPAPLPIPEKKKKRTVLKEVEVDE